LPGALHAAANAPASVHAGLAALREAPAAAARTAAWGAAAARALWLHLAAGADAGRGQLHARLHVEWWVWLLVMGFACSHMDGSGIMLRCRAAGACGAQTKCLKQATVQNVCCWACRAVQGCAHKRRACAMRTHMHTHAHAHRSARMHKHVHMGTCACMHACLASGAPPREEV